MNIHRKPVSANGSFRVLRCTSAWSGILLFLSPLLVSSPAFAQPPITSLAFSPDGSQIIIGSQSGIQIFDSDQRPVGRLETELEFINGIRFSKDGMSVAIVGGSPSESGSLEVFAWPKGQLKFRKQICDDVLYDVDWSPDGKHLAMAGHDTDGCLLNLNTRQVEQRWAEHSRPVVGVRFFSDPNLLVSASIDQTIRVWETDNHKAVRSLNNHTAEINDIAVSPTGNQPRLKMVVSVGQDKTVRFWQPAIGRMVRFARLPSIPLCVQWDGQGRYVVVGCEDGKVFVVDSQTVIIEGQTQWLDGPVFSIARQPKQDVFAFGGPQNRWQILTLDRLKNGIGK